MPEKLFFWRNLAALGVQGLLVLLVLGAFATPARAHRVLVFAYAEGDTIHTESKFIPDTPIRQGKIMVLDAKTGRELLTGKTDDQGKFSFKIPAQAAAGKMDLRIVAEAAMGHRGEWLLKAANYLGGAQTAATPAPAPAAPAPAPAATAAATPAAPVDKAANVAPATLETALNKALERQLAPINEKLTEMTIHRTSLPDILGGIGYILGFFGVWAYFQSKRQKES
jgi:nickel transport protein